MDRNKLDVALFQANNDIANMNWRIHEAKIKGTYSECLIFQLQDMKDYRNKLIAKWNSMTS